MLKRTVLILLVILPTFLFAQSSLWGNDTTSKRIIQNDCDDKIFTRVENLASLKTSHKTFEDTLASFLKLKKAFPKNGKIRFKFIVTTNSQIFDLEKDSGDIRKEAIVKEAILNFSNLWLPAKQNGRLVCAYVRLEIDIVDDKLDISITQ